MVHQGTGRAFYDSSYLAAIANPPGGVFTWSSDDPTIVLVNPDQTVPDGSVVSIVGQQVGATTIRVTYGFNGAIANQTSINVQNIYPIVLVHGLISDPSTWNDLSNALQQRNMFEGNSFCTTSDGSSNIDYCAVDFRTLPNNGTDSEGNQSSFILEGQLLRGIILNLRNLTGSDKVVIAAHSMGGLASRAYMELFNGQDVDTLITFGTPHLGSDVANLASDIILRLSVLPDLAVIAGIDPDSPAVRGLATGSADLKTVNQDAVSSLPVPPGTLHVSLIGKASFFAAAAATVGWGLVLDFECNTAADPFVCADMIARTPSIVSFFFDSDLLVRTGSQNIGNVEILTFPIVNGPFSVIHTNETKQIDHFLEYLGGQLLPIP